MSGPDDEISPDPDDKRFSIRCSVALTLLYNTPVIALVVSICNCGTGLVFARTLLLFYLTFNLRHGKHVIAPGGFHPMALYVNMN